MDLNGLFDINNRDITMSSLNLCKLINELRLEEGNKSELKHFTLMRNIKEEIKKLENVEILTKYSFVLSSYKADDKVWF